MFIEIFCEQYAVSLFHFNTLMATITSTVGLLFLPMPFFFALQCAVCIRSRDENFLNRKRKKRNFKTKIDFDEMTPIFVEFDLIRSPALNPFPNDF